MSFAEPSPDGLSLLTVREVASVWGVSQETVRARVRSGKVPAYRLGERGTIRIPSSAVADHLQETVRASVETR